MNHNLIRHLSPKTASHYGYEFAGDFKVKQKDLDQDVLYLLNSGYKLGQPASIHSLPEFIGLYRPVDEKNEGSTSSVGVV